MIPENLSSNLAEKSCNNPGPLMVLDIRIINGKYIFICIIYVCRYIENTIYASYFYGIKQIEGQSLKSKKNGERWIACFIPPDWHDHRRPLMPEFPHTGPPRKTHVMNHNMKCGTISSAKKQKASYKTQYTLGMATPFLVIVNTRIFTCLVGNPFKSSFVTVSANRTIPFFWPKKVLHLVASKKMHPNQNWQISRGDRITHNTTTLRWVFFVPCKHHHHHLYAQKKHLLFFQNVHPSDSR